MLIRGSAVPCMISTGQVIRSRPGRDVERAGQDGFLVGRGIGEVQQQLAGVLPVSFQGRLRSMAKNRLRPGPDAVISVATGASRIAIVRPAISAVAW